MSPGVHSSSPAYPAPKDALPEERDEILSAYRSLAGSVKTAIEGLTREQMLAHPIPGTWSIHQIVLHLADCELVFADRFKRIISDETPQLMAFDENKWMENLVFPSRSADQAATLLELTRLDLAGIFQLLPPEKFARTGTHEEIGPISLLALIKRANWHIEHHLKFLRQKKQLLLQDS